MFAMHHNSDNVDASDLLILDPMGCFAQLACSSSLALLEYSQATTALQLLHKQPDRACTTEACYFTAEYCACTLVMTNLPGQRHGRQPPSCTPST